jgi:PAS domain S-box-containing protein
MFSSKRCLEDNPMAKKLTYRELEHRVKALEKTLVTFRHDKRKSEAIIESIGDGISIIDTDFKILYQNKVHRDIHGNHNGENCYMAYWETDQICEGCPAEATFKDGKIHTRERSVRTKKGVSYFEVKASPVRDSTGKITGAVEAVRDITKHKHAEESLKNRSHELHKRIKELNCLYGISHLVEEGGVPLEKILQATADLLPLAWQYPEITCARITVRGQQFKTKNFRKTTWNQSRNIFVHRDRVGVVEVYYLEKKPKIDEGPFMKDERKLLDAVAERVGRIIERRRAEEWLIKAHDELKAKSHHLQEVNTALRVLLKQREHDKEELQENVLSNVKELVTPHLERLKKGRLDVNQTALVSVLESNINSIVSPFIRKLLSTYVSLTPMEIRVADFIKEGRTNKEIGELLFLSPNTVKFHRYNIRTKLGLKNKKMNLRSYLLSLAR